jgi:hypothetical protein
VEERGVSCAARKCSTSKAATQPEPAAVMAWRHSLSCTSPHAKTPSTEVVDRPGDVTTYPSSSSASWPVREVVRPRRPRPILDRVSLCFACTCKPFATKRRFCWWPTPVQCHEKGDWRRAQTWDLSASHPLAGLPTTAADCHRPLVGCSGG